MLFSNIFLQTFASYFLGSLISLVIITNPLSKIPLFISLTNNMPLDLQHKHANKACIYAFIMLTVSLFAGVFILRGFGISYGALRIAGGLTVALLGYRMLFQTTDANTPTPHVSQNIAFFPIAMPGISGPGAIAVVIGISTEIAELKTQLREVVAYSATVASILIACFVIWVALRSAYSFSRLLGAEGMDALSRLMGFVMVCIGVQLVGSGVRTFLSGA